MNKMCFFEFLYFCMIGSILRQNRVSLIVYFFFFFFFTQASKSVSDAKPVIPMVKQPVFLRSMSAPSDLEMIANQDLEFTHAPQRYLNICV